MNERNIVPEDYRKLKRLATLCRSQKGALAYTTYYWDGYKYRRGIEIFDGSELNVSAGGICERESEFCPTGHVLGFISDGRVYVYDIATRDTQLFYQREGWEATGFLFLSGKGCMLIKLRREIRETAPEGCEWQLPLVAEELHYRNDADHGFTKKYDYRLDVRAADGSSRTIADGKRDWQNMALSADGENLIFSQGNYKLMNLKSGETRVLDETFTAASSNFAPAVARDGRYILAGGVQTDDYRMEMQLKRIWLEDGHVDAAPQNAPCGIYCSDAVADSTPERHNVIVTGENPDEFFVLGYDNARVGVYRVDASGAALKYELISRSGGTYFEICAPKNGALGCIWGDAKHAAEVCELNIADGALKPIAKHNAWLDERRLFCMTQNDAPSQDGRATLHGYVMLPDNVQGAPTLLWVHGGPSGFYADALSLEIQSAAGAGYAVILANPRASTGYGRAYENTDHAFDGGAANDLLAYMDSVLAKWPMLDRTRVGVLGGSYGGFMSAWMAGNTARFKAAVVMRAVTNWLFIHFKSSQSGQPVFESYRDFQDFLVDTIKTSPIASAGDVNIPTLIIHGEQDQTCPVENAHQFYVAVRDTHPELPLKLMVMPNCSHGISRDALPDFIAVQRATLEWLNRYV